MKTISNQDQEERRVLALLHEAAGWEADSPPPLGMVGRALARQERKKQRPALWKPIGLAISPFALAAIIFLAISPNQGSIFQPNTKQLSVTAAELPFALSPDAEVRMPAPQAVLTRPIMSPTIQTVALRRSLRYGRRSALRSSVLPKRTRTVPPRALWKTEEVQETRYALLTPAVLTETNRENGSEEAIPIFVSIPVPDSTNDMSTIPDGEETSVNP